MKKGKGHKKGCKCCFCFHKKKQRWSNKPWNPNDRVLKYIHAMKLDGWSYRYIARALGRDFVTVRKYYLRWLPNRNWFLRLLNWLFENKIRR